MYVSKLPIAISNKKLEARITQLASRVVETIQTDSHAFVGELESEIDGLVAHLYGLTEEEYRLLLDDLDLPDPVRVGALNAYRETAKNAK